jgi:DNA-binding transcriptional MerR regulator
VNTQLVDWIGEVAARSGVAIYTIRYCERQEVLPSAAWVNGHRRDDADAVIALAVIYLAKEAGFTLEEVKTLLCECRRLLQLVFSQSRGRFSRAGRCLSCSVSLVTSTPRSPCECTPTSGPPSYRPRRRCGP